MIKISVPANVLLMGEYSILENGAYGLSCAVEPRLTLRAEFAERWSITAIGPGETASFSFEEYTADGVPRVIQHSGFAWTNPRVFQLIIDELIYKKGFNPIAGIRPFAITIDSSPFFHNGKKLGFGSSAALVVAMAKLFSLFALGENGPFPPWEFDDFCLDVHKKLQGGKGSGYDILTSIHGGLIHLEGGDREKHRCKDSEAASLEYAFTEEWRKGVYYTGITKLEGFIVCAVNEVKTCSAIDAYNDYKKRHPIKATRFRDKSQKLIKKVQMLLKPYVHSQLALSKSENNEAYARFVGVLRQAGKLGVAFGDELGVSARFPYSIDGFVKCLGAGNEMAYVTALPEGNAEHLTVFPFTIAHGLTVEETE